MMYFLRDYWMNLCKNAFIINMGYFNAFLRLFFPSFTEEPTLPDFKEDLKNYDVDFDLNNAIIKVFECGLNSRHIQLDSKEEWDGSALDKILSSCLRELNITQGDSYYKGIFYKVFLLGYYYS